VGRGQQCRVLDELTADVPAGRSPVLVVRGEPGIGKTALLGHAAETAQDFPGVSRRGRRIGDGAAVRGAASAARSMPGRLDRLPGPQRDALGVTSGLRPGYCAGSFPGQPGPAEPAAGGGRRPAAAVPGRRCALAGPGPGPGAGVRGPPVDAESVALVSGTRDGAAGGDLAGLPGLALALAGLPDLPQATRAAAVAVRASAWLQTKRPPVQSGHPGRGFPPANLFSDRLPNLMGCLILGAGWERP
jgi:hypothetical protein